MTSHRETFLANSRRLIDAIGDPIPAKVNEKVLEQAERALQGDVCQGPDGAWAHIGLADIDWSCAKTYNPPHIEMYVRRFHMLEPLTAAYRATGDERYARGARTYIEQFLQDHPTREDWEPKPGDGATQYDIRVGTFDNAGWLGSLPVLLDSPSFDDAFFERIVAAARVHLLYLEKHVWPDRNIRTLHGEVQILTGLRLSWLAEAARWRRAGVRITNDAVRRQVLPDGVHMEAAPGYHNVVLRVFEEMWFLARGFPELGLEVPREAVAGMHDYALHCTRPDGGPISLHDTRYVASTGSFGDHERRARAAFRSAAGLPDELPPAAVHFPHAGQVFLRDRWDEQAAYLTFDAATRRSYHWHPSRNSITLFAHGRALLVDPGYTFHNEEFATYGHKTSHHNTMNLNGWDQSQSQAQLRLMQAEGYDLVEGLYDGGYWPLEHSSHGAGRYAEHHRTLLWIRGRCIVVLDHLYNTPPEGDKPRVETIWQLSEGPARIDPQQRRAVTGHGSGNLLMLFPLWPEGTEMTLHEGEKDPWRGWLPIEWGRRCITAPMVRLAAESHDPWSADAATVLLPFAGTTPPQMEVQAQGFDHTFNTRSAARLVLRWEDGSSDEVLWTRRFEHAINQQHGLDTDAGLVHLQRDGQGNVVQALRVDGSYLEAPGLNDPRTVRTTQRRR